MARKSTKTAASSTVTLKPVKPKVATKAPAAAKAPRPTVVAAAKPIAAGNQVKKPEFLERVLEKTDVKRRDAKPAIEAALAELATILMAGDEVNIPPLGKLKVVKSKEVGEGAQVLTLKLRTMKDGAGQSAAKEETAEI